MALYIGINGKQAGLLMFDYITGINRSPGLAGNVLKKPKRKLLVVFCTVAERSTEAKINGFILVRSANRFLGLIYS